MQLGHDDGVFGVDGTVGDPILLCERMRGVDNDFISFLVVDGRRFHLNGIVAITEFGESEAANVVQCVNT